MEVYMSDFNDSSYPYSTKPAFQQLLAVSRQLNFMNAFPNIFTSRFWYKQSFSERVCAIKITFFFYMRMWIKPFNLNQEFSRRKKKNIRIFFLFGIARCFFFFLIEFNTSISKRFFNTKNVCVYINRKNQT